MQLHFTTRVRYGFLSVQLNYTIRQRIFSKIILELKNRKRNEVFPFLFLFVLSQNKAANNGFEEVDFDSRILAFKPILYYSAMPSWNGGVTDNGLVKATGEIEISYAEHSGTQVNYNSQHGTISLGKIPSNDIDKAVTISGGYQSETIVNVSSDRKRLIEATLSYIREHLDDFKVKAFNAIPESSNAIKFIIISPDDIPMGSSHGGSQGGGH